VRVAVAAAGDVATAAVNAARYLQGRDLMQTRIARSLKVPDDVLAELDLEERRATGVDLPPSEAAVPEEVRSELDHEARLAGEEQRLTLAEGSPPALEQDATA
jgi:hypothetical protein